jgi:hypothetical protein
MKASSYEKYKVPSGQYTDPLNTFLLLSHFSDISSCQKSTLDGGIFRDALKSGLQAHRMGDDIAQTRRLEDNVADFSLP